MELNSGAEVSLAWTPKGRAHWMGVAHKSDVCRSVNASGIVSYDMTYVVALYTAHELGHLYDCLSVTSSGLTVLSAGVTDALADPDTICRRARKNKGSFMCKVNIDDFIKTKTCSIMDF
ncbi:hypothetical protein PoB_005323200 [Plakobranchus ocellatus]|uniref:Peptidase M12B domain-containing protein n=1 Tax=Plakobranchus ocellatus TaxID=259542 RepID=A0AAV4C572_9GAST|nr:hypothetical protein PoB_005323200 [Plakobranchus ocellatus]